MNQPKSDNLIKHGSIMLAATLIGGAANYLYHYLMIRLMTTAQYGELKSLLGLFMIVSIPAGTIAVVITKYVASFKRQGKEATIGILFRKALLMFGLTGLALAAVFTVAGRPVAAYLHLTSVTPVVIVGLILCVSLVSTVIMGMLQGLQAFFLLGFTSIYGALAKMAFGAGLVLLAFGVTGALGGLLIATMTGIAIMLVPLRRYFLGQHVLAGEHVPLDKKEVFQYAVPAGGAILCFSFLTFYDPIVVKHFFNPSAAGSYAACELIGKAFLFPPAAFAGALLPKVAEMHAAGRSPFPLLKKALFINIAVLLAGAVVCVSFPEAILHVLLRGKAVDYPYESLVFLMRVFGVMVMPYGLLNILIYYQLARHQKRFIIPLAGGAVSLFVLLQIFHGTLLQVVCALGAVGYALFAVVFLMIFFTRETERPDEGISGEDLYINAGV